MTDRTITLEKGHRLHNRYEIRSVLGQGGFGTVYKAVDNLLNQIVAIKSSSKSLYKESRLLMALKDVPYISHIYDYFVEDGSDYIVMRYVKGVSLASYYREDSSRINVSFIKSVLPSISMSLYQMHKLGIVHRDISPGNLLLTEDGSLYLIDFGTATSTKHDSLKNMLHFSHKGLDAPERTNEMLLGPGTDIYSLCATIIFLLSGEGVPSYTDRLQYDPVPQFLPKLSLSGKQQNALMKGLSININNRYNDISDFVRDFKGDGSIFDNTNINYLVKYNAKTDIGKKFINQDNFMIDTYFTYAGEDCTIQGIFPSDSGHIHMVAVADGVTNSNHGELASKAAIQAVSHFIDSYKFRDELPDRLLEELLNQLNEKLISLGNKIGSTATTISILLWKNNTYYAANIGDSPIYLLRGSKLMRLSTPHTKAHEMLATNPNITMKDVHALTRYLGKKNSSGSQMASYSFGQLSFGDTFLLCTDGISNAVNDDILKKALKKEGEKTLAALWKCATKLENMDNCSAVVVKFMNPK